MKSLDLYKFINDNKIEWHKQNNDGGRDVIIFLYYYHIEDFRKILSTSLFDDSGIECRMKDGYFCFWMRDICEYYGIELNEVFDKENWDS